MQTQIFSTELLNSPGKGGDGSTEDGQRKNAVADLQEQINAFLKGKSGVRIMWLQSGGAGTYGAFTQLTAVIEHNDSSA